MLPVAGTTGVKRFFWVHKYNKKFYPYDRKTFSSRGPVHDLDAFKVLIRRDFRVLLSSLPPSPPPSPKITGGHAVMTVCRHSFCSGCLASSCKIKPTCPECRSDLTDQIPAPVSHPLRGEALGACAICTSDLTALTITE